MLKRHAIQVLRQAGHTLGEIAEQVAVGQRSVQRVVAPDPKGERGRSYSGWSIA